MAKNPDKLKFRRRLTLGVLTLALIAVGSFAWSVRGCEGTASRSTTRVTLGGKPFTLEVAADNATRYKGLSGRASIEDDGGMIFVFSRPQILRFVMRDCLIDIDIIYLDSMGTVVRTHAMKLEAPRGPGEGAVGETNPTYDGRLKSYSSGLAAQFAIEIQPGMIEKLGIKQGDRIELNLRKLKGALK
jgi:uncharacterized protein